MMTSVHKLVLLSIGCTLLTPATAAAQAPGVEAGSASGASDSAVKRARAEAARAHESRESQRGAAPAAGAVAVPKDAPSLPAAPYKKTQPNELRDTPAKKPIRALEDLFYIMHKHDARIWVWRVSVDAGYPPGDGSDEIAYVDKQMAKAQTLLAEIAQLDPSWPRTAEYQTTVAYLQRVQAAQRAYYGAVVQAQEAAAVAAEQATAAAWQAKRKPDAGVVGALHAASVGKLVFASQAIADGAPTATAFAVDAPLYAAAYFKESPWNALHTAGVDCADAPDTLKSFQLRAYFQITGGERFLLETEKFDEATFGRMTSWRLGEGKDVTVGGAFRNGDEEGLRFRWIARVVGGLAPGANGVAFDVRAWCYGAPHDGVPVASASLTLKGDEKALAAVQKRARFTLAPSQHQGGALGPFRAVIDAAYRNRLRVLEFRTGGQWSLVRNPLGVVLRRTMPTVVLAQRKDRPACELVSVELAQEFDGQSYGPTRISYESARPFVCQWQ